MTRPTQEAAPSIKPGDIVTPKGQHYPKGDVQSVARGWVVVSWPSGAWTRERAVELRRL
jgi:hypothetical protein